MTSPQYMLDSNICIYVLADQASAAARQVAEQVTGTVVTSAIAYAEVMRGIPSEEREARGQAGRFFEAISPLPFEQAAANCYALLPFRRGGFDRLIAGHALAQGLVLVTNNERDFIDIPGLRLENWTL